MFTTTLPKLPLPAKVLVLLFLAFLGVSYILSLMNVNFAVGLSVKAVQNHYAPQATESEFGAVEAPGVRELVNEMHFHIAAHAMMFFLLGLIIMMAELPVWAKTGLIAWPFLAMALDMGSIWLTRFVHPGFAVGVMLGGILMASGFAVNAAVAAWQMLIMKPKG
jgi:hypothetical protein